MINMIKLFLITLFLFILFIFNTSDTLAAIRVPVPNSVPNLAQNPTTSPVPRLQNIFSANPLPASPQPGYPGFANLGAIVSSFFIIALNIAVVLTLFWLVWGVYQYIIAGGDKEGLQHARSRITWALVGLLFLAAAYLIAQYAAEFLEPKGGIIF